MGWRAAKLGLVACAAAGITAVAALAAGPLATIDGSPPAATNNTSATFTFHAASKSATFLCKLDGGAFAACTSPHTLTGLSEAQHTFAVKTNASGDTAASYTWSVDLTPPNTIVSQHPATLSNSATSTFVFTSGDPTATFRCTLNGSTPQPCTSPVTYTGLADATRTLTIAAVDPAGNVDPAAPTITWTTDTTPPDTTVAPPSGMLIAEHTITFTYTSTESGSTFECSLGMMAFAACPAGSDTVLINRSGSHSFRVRAVDAAGNTDPTPAVYKWTSDLTPPNRPKVALFADPSASASAIPTTLMPVSGLGVTLSEPIVTVPTTPAFSLVGRLRAQWSSDATAVSYEVAVISTVEATVPSTYFQPTIRIYHSLTKQALTVRAQPGNSICVAVRARDDVGNKSATARRCTTIPFSFAPPWNTVGAYQRVRATRAWRGYYIRMKTHQYIYGLAGEGGYDIPTRIALVAERCRECGKVEIGWTRYTSSLPARPQLKRLAIFDLGSSHTTGSFDLHSVVLHSKSIAPGIIIFEAISGNPHLAGVALRSGSASRYAGAAL